MKSKLNKFLFDENKVLKKRNLIILLILALLLNTGGVTLARYAYQEIREHFFRTKRFYFNCDKLSEAGSNIEMTNWSGVGQYTVTFNMNSYSNQILASDENIEYDIDFECSNNVTCSIENNKTNGTITTQTKTDSFTIVITVPTETILHDQDRVELYVEATATTPYEKKLKGTIALVVGHYGLSYEIEDSVNNPYLNTIITNTLDYYVVKQAFGNYAVGAQLDMDTYQNLSNTDKEKCASSIITLEFDPNTVLLDMTSEIYQNALSTETVTIGGYNYVKKISFKIDAMSSSKIKFYKNDITKNYTYPRPNVQSVITVTYS